MRKLDTPFGSTTKRQRWLLLPIAIIVFIVLVYGFSLAFDNLMAQYGTDNAEKVDKVQ